MMIRMIRLCSQICKKKIVSHASLKSIIHQAHVRKMATPYSSITSDGSWTLHYLATWAEVDHDRMAKGILYNYVSPSIQVTSLAGCGTVCVSTVFTLGPQVQVTLLSLMCYSVHRFVCSHIWCFLSVKQNAIDHATHYCRRWVTGAIELQRQLGSDFQWTMSSKTCPLNWNMPNRMRTWNPMERSWSTPYSFSIKVGGIQETTPVSKTWQNVSTSLSTCSYTVCSNLLGITKIAPIKRLTIPRLEHSCSSAWNSQPLGRVVERPAQGWLPQDVVKGYVDSWASIKRVAGAVCHRWPWF